MSTDQPPIAFVENPYGFKWGAMEVTRMASTPDGSTVLNVRGVGQPYYDEGVTVTVSPKGKSVRAFRGSEEMK